MSVNQCTPYKKSLSKLQVLDTVLDIYIIYIFLPQLPYLCLLSNLVYHSVA